VAGTLYIVGTPIGNLGDISFRAIDALKNADIIACEDTRHTKILLDRYSIKTATTSYHKFNIRSKTRHIMDQLKTGRNVALVSDAGMPGISDPGQELIGDAAASGIRIEVIPGPSASISALSLSGFGSGRFAFEGFLPVKPSQRKGRLQALTKEQRTIIIYEAPHRLARTLEALIGSLGDRRVCVARELTKKFEEVSRGRISEMIDKFAGVRPKGEFVIVIEGKGESSFVKTSEDRLVGLVDDLAKAGFQKSEAVKIVAKRMNIPKNTLYRDTLGN